jgi:signal transduction histidine kinase
MDDLLLVGRVVSAGSGLGLVAVAGYALRVRDTPAASSFAVLVGILGVAGLCGAATAHTGTLYKLVWLATTLAIPMALALFAFDYYGLTDVDSRLRVAVALVPAALGLAGGTLVILGAPGATGGAPVPALAMLPGPVFDLATTLRQVGIYYTTGVALVAVGLVARTVYRYRHLETTLGPVVAGIGVWPWLTYLLFPKLTGTVATDVLLLGVASGYAGSLGLAAVAVGPLGLFESTPAAGNVGPETVLDSMDDAVVVVDDSDHVLRLNAVACETFGTTPAAAVGGPLTDVLGQSLAALPADGTVSLPTAEGTREFAVTCSAVTGRAGEDRGYALVLSDVTRRQTREQRLSVLNRVLRHNLRNDATSIIGRARLIADGGDADESAERIVETTHGLVSTAERAREIQAMMTADGPETTAVAAVLDRVVTDIETDYPAVEVTTALPDDATAAVDPTVFETVVRNVVENAAGHNDADEPIVVVSADETDGRLSVAVADNGPGIPEHERAVLEAGEESDLEHGSGLGLWAVHWGVTRMGGELSFAENDPRGSVVTVTVPSSRPSAGQDGNAP